MIFDLKSTRQKMQKIEGGCLKKMKRFNRSENFYNIFKIKRLT